MAEVAGLVLGVIAISGLFSACIESFDVVISGKNFSNDYEQLCALVSCSFSIALRSRFSSHLPMRTRLHYSNEQACFAYNGMNIGYQIFALTNSVKFIVFPAES